VHRTPYALLVIALMAGCAKEERAHRVSGTVTWNGRNVPAGLVFFDPDGTRGTRGGQGFATIKDGKFDTAVEGQGVRGGAYMVRILGYDGKVANEAPMGQPLFDEYQEARDLPAADSEQTFAVPGKGR
jgi:hypothetical protein